MSFGADNMSFAALNVTSSIKNITDNRTISTDYFLSNEWIKYQSVVIVLWFLSAYILTAVIVYEVRHRAVRTRARATSSSNIEMTRVSVVTSASQRPFHTRTASSTNASMRVRSENTSRPQQDLLTRISLLAAALFLFFHCNNIFVELHLGWKSHTACVVTFQCAVLFYATSIAAVYIMLWDRQHKLYKAQTLKHLTTSFLRKISAATLIITIVLSLASVIILNLSAAPFSSSRGCYRENTSLPRWVRIAILPVLGVIQQAMLLGLVIYPLIKHSSSQLASTTKSTATICSVIKRLAICTGCCVFSDILFIGIMTVVTHGESSGVLGQILTNFNLFVNVVFLCLSFASWKERLFMTKRKKRIGLQSSSTF